jgi:CBS domain containing-hemolysin-like protein
MLLTWFAIFFVLGLAVLFTLTEYALVKVRLSALRDLQDKRDKPSKNIANAIHMVENLTEYLSTAQFGITVTSLILGWLGESTLAKLILDTGLLPAAGAHAIASALALLIFTFVHAVFSDLVPKNIAIAEPVKVLLLIARPVRFFHVTFFPLIWVFDRSAVVVTRMLGYDVAQDEDIYSQNEILSLSRNAAQAGELEEEDLTFMQRAFDMNDKVAVDIMIDRTSMEAIDVTATLKEAFQKYLETSYSRFPVVANGDKDKVVGYIYNYDVIRQSRIDDGASVATVMHDMPAVPENMDVHEIYDLMMKKRTPFVLVVDEYGGTSGLITDKDIYEELFGSLREEVDDDNDMYFEKLGDNRYRISGKSTLYDVERYFGVTIKDFEEDEAVTLAGYVLNNDPDFRKDHVLKIDRFEFKALDYDNAYISAFEVTELPPTSAVDEPEKVTS